MALDKRLYFSECTVTLCFPVIMVSCENIGFEEHFSGLPDLGKEPGFLTWCETRKGTCVDYTKGPCITAYYDNDDMGCKARYGDKFWCCKSSIIADGECTLHKEFEPTKIFECMHVDNCTRRGGEVLKAKGLCGGKPCRKCCRLDLPIWDIVPNPLNSSPGMMMASMSPPLSLTRHLTTTTPGETTPTTTPRETTPTTTPRETTPTTTPRETTPTTTPRETTPTTTPRETTPTTTPRETPPTTTQRETTPTTTPRETTPTTTPPETTPTTTPRETTPTTTPRETTPTTTPGETTPTTTPPETTPTTTPRETTPTTTPRETTPTTTPREITPTTTPRETTPTTTPRKTTPTTTQRETTPTTTPWETTPTTTPRETTPTTTPRETTPTTTPGETTPTTTPRETTPTTTPGETSPTTTPRETTPTTTPRETTPTTTPGETSPTTTPVEDTTEKAPCFTEDEMDALRKKISFFEGIKFKAYDAKPNDPNVIDWTICIGFNLKRDDARAVFKKVLPGVNFDDVYKGTKALTEEQCLALLENDLKDKYIPIAKTVAGDKFCELPLNVRIAIVNAVYRGDLKFSHQTAKHIRNGEWCKVKAEYLNNDEYKNAVKNGMTGIKTRMDWNAEQFHSMCKE